MTRSAAMAPQAAGEYAARPTAGLEMLQQAARSADEALDPGRLGLARATRHSFARSFLRVAAAERWTVHRERFDIDRDGRGEAVYQVNLGPQHMVHLVVFSTTIDEGERTDRVIAKAWDVTASLYEGELTDDRIERMRNNVPSQELGRAQSGALVWTRANRSVRFFDYVVDSLAAGRQPEAEKLGDAAYVMRSTAFYANGKWGLTDFGGFAKDHPLRTPYRAQMLTAWLLREFSLDLVEHCAALRSEDAAVLSPAWSRFFGLGNATGLGMVPFVINHPLVLDAWVAMRELPLANALALTALPGDATTSRVMELLQRAIVHLSERDTLVTKPYPSCPALAEDLRAVLAVVAEFNRTGCVAGEPVTHLMRAIHELTEGPAQALVESILIELDDSLDNELELLLPCAAQRRADPAVSCGAIREAIADRYRWIDSFDFEDGASTAYFWYYSADSQEPRRGVRGQEPGAEVEQSIDVARAIRSLLTDLEQAAADTTAALFLLQYPWHRWAIDRVCGLASARYSEARVNPLAADFLPLQLQRFQLAAYGMENFSPQSTDWLRVTLFSGAPRRSDIEVGLDDDWMFATKPQAVAYEPEGAQQ